MDTSTRSSSLSPEILAMAESLSNSWGDDAARQYLALVTSHKYLTRKPVGLKGRKKWRAERPANVPPAPTPDFYAIALAGMGGNQLAELWVNEIAIPSARAQENNLKKGLLAPDQVAMFLPYEWTSLADIESPYVRNRLRSCLKSGLIETKKEGRIRFYRRKYEEIAQNQG